MRWGRTRLEAARGEVRVAAQRHERPEGDRRRREEVAAGVDRRSLPLVSRGSRSRSGCVRYRDRLLHALKTPAVTASGKPKDQFHFTYDTAQFEQLSGSGVEVGYGITLAALSR